MSDKNQPAFPHTVVDSSTNFDLDLIYSGMTLRQYAAIKAMQGLLAFSPYNHSTKEIAARACDHADALFAALEAK
jgi:hypothetical protein